MKKNVYKVTYKNGVVRELNSYCMELSEGKVYELSKAYPFDNFYPTVFDGSLIESIVCIERNNDL